MGWLLEARGRASVGQWVGTALLAIGVVTGQLQAPQLLFAAWLENISVGIAATVSLARSNRHSVAVPPWMAAKMNQRRSVGRRPVGPAFERQAPPPAGAPQPPPWAPQPQQQQQPPPPSPSPSAPSSSQPPPPPPGAQPTAPGLHPGAGAGSVPPGHVPLAMALLLLLVPLAMMTSFQGNFISILGRFGSLGADAGGGSVAGGVVATVLLVVAAAVRSFRRIDPDQALGYAFGHVVTLHLGIMIGFFAIVGAAFGGAITGSTGPMELVATGALVGWFAFTDRLKVGNRTPG